MPRAISSKWCNDCRCASSFKTTTQTRILCSSAFRLSPTSTLIGRRQDPMLVSVCKPPCRNRRQPLWLRPRWAATNDRGGDCASRAQRGDEPLVGGGCCGGADLYGGARHHDRRGRTALYRGRAVGDGHR